MKPLRNGPFKIFYQPIDVTDELWTPDGNIRRTRIEFIPFPIFQKYLCIFIAFAHTMNKVLFRLINQTYHTCFKILFTLQITPPNQLIMFLMMILFEMRMMKHQLCLTISFTKQQIWKIIVILFFQNLFLEKDIIKQGHQMSIFHQSPWNI